MPPATAYDDQAWTGRDAFVSVVAFDCLCVPVSDLRRATRFYSGLFAMRVVAGGVDEGRVVLSRGGRVRLALYPHNDSSAVPATRICATVESLEAARETVWDLGIATLRDLVAPDGANPARHHSFVIADPDGHEVHFTERTKGGSVTTVETADPARRNR